MVKERVDSSADTELDGLVAGAFADGESLEVGGNSPLLLTQPDAVWMVESGSVYVFIVPMEGGVPAGARTYLFSLDPGDLVFSLEEDPALVSNALLISGRPGSRVRRLPQIDLNRLLAHADTRVEVEGLIEQWVDRVSTAVHGGLPPHESEDLEPRSEVNLAEDASGRPQDHQLVWARLETGRVSLWGRDEIDLPRDGVWFPLTDAIWVTASEPTTLSVAPTSDVASDAALWPGLRAFHRAMLESAGLRAIATQRSEAARLQSKAAADQAAFDGALAELANEFQPDDGVRVPTKTVEDPLLAAATLVGEAAGIPIVEPPRSAAAQPGDRLFAIANASRMRTRKIAFRGRWWTAESQPTLAFRGANQEPVALVPNGRRGYLLIDPMDGSRQEVTQQVADMLEPFGHVFYRPLPEERVTLKDLIRFGVRRSGLDLSTTLLMAILGGALSLLIPIFTGTLFDEVIPSAQRTQVLIIALALVVAAIGSALFQVTGSLALLRVESRMGFTTQAGLWDRLLTLPVPFFHRFSTGDLQMRAMGIDTIRQLLGVAVASSLLAGIYALFSFGLLFYYSVQLALLTLIPIVLLVGITLFLNYFQLRYQRQVMAYQGELNGMVVQFITGIAKLRVAAAENRAFAVWASGFARQTAVTSKVRRITVHLNALQAVTPALTTVVLFVGVAYFISSLSVGTFMAFNTALGQFLTATLALTSVLVLLLQVLPIFERSQAILIAEPEVGMNKVDPGIVNGDIEVNNVDFRYHPDGPLILDDVSLRIRPGQFVALVGPSGSGKSTLLRLLMGFEEPSSGTIYYDRQDLSSLDVRSLRRQVGVVLQQSQLMPGDIHTNILGNTGYSIDQAWEAARMAGFEDDIKSMPMGMFTSVSEGISTLSGGQRQRLMIARALVSKPRVIFFDEATSALDNETQSTVSQSLGALKATRIVIAHRLSTIQGADLIYVLEDGRVAQAGSFQELMEQEGPFRELARRQII